VKSTYSGGQVLDIDGLYCLFMPWMWEQYVPVKHWQPPTILHGVIIEKTKTEISVGVLVSYLKFMR